MFKLVTERDPTGGYALPSTSHSAASAAALAELATVVTESAQTDDGRPLHVRLSHYEHGGFLTLQLYGFMLIPATAEIVTRPAYPPLPEDFWKPATLLLSPNKASPEQPLRYAVVANHSVAAQIEHTLSSLAMLIGRQQLVSTYSSDDVSRMDLIAGESDARELTALTDVLRTQGWQAAAKAIGVRSKAAGFRLIVSYDPLLVSREDLAIRAPVLRHVYNEIEAVRQAVDKTASLLSQGFITTGRATEQVASFARDHFDLASIRTYLAHVARDAFVCGNGYLSFGELPDEDISLLRPEEVVLIDAGTARVNSNGKEQIHRRILHIRGAEQVGSEYGVSVLEPFVRMQEGLESMRSLDAVATIWDQDEVPDEFRSWALQNSGLIERNMASINDEVLRTLGGASTISVTPPSDLYFSGFESMLPAAAALLMEGNIPRDYDGRR